MIPTSKIFDLSGHQQCKWKQRDIAHNTEHCNAYQRGPQAPGRQIVPPAAYRNQASKRQSQNNQRIQSECRRNISARQLVQGPGRTAARTVKTRKPVKQAGRQKRVRGRIEEEERYPRSANRERNDDPMTQGRHRRA